MKTSLLVCSALLALTDARSAPRFVKEDVQPAVDPNYYLQGVRGLWVGYQSGFYKNTKKNAANCLNDQTTQNLANIVNFMNGSGDMSQAFTLVTEGMQILGNFQVECGVEQTLEDLVSFCNNNPDNCTGATVL
jgi:hypothetical protein